MVDTRMTSAPIGTRTSSVGEHLNHAYVDWASVAGGAVVATAIFTTLSIFGSAVGLSLTSAHTDGGVSGKATAIAVGLWAAWVAVSSFAAGGYVAGRLRHRISDASEHEVEMRDGLHGLIAWGLAGLISGLILTSAVSGLASAGGGKATAVSTVENLEMNKLFRGQKGYDPASHGEVKTVLDTAMAGATIDATDRTYLAQVVAPQAGVSPAIVATRVDEAIAEIKNTLDSARRGAVLAAFLAAVSLALGAAAAWWAAIEGGKHRDDGTLVSPLTRW